MLPTIEWQDDAIVMVDQRKLPGHEVYVRCRRAQEVARAIRTMVIRGAPAIGVAAAMGIALGLRRSKARGTGQLAAEFYRTCELMAGTRPTAVNLFWAIERLKQVFAASVRAGHSTDEVTACLEAEARRIHDEDVESCRALGAHGVAVVPDAARILTHCNAGALATAGYGTALGVVRAAVEHGKQVTVLADETRPFLQGARLTAWELVRDGIETTVITDGLAGPLMREGQVDLVVVGAPTGSRPTATSPTRSAPMRSRFSRASMRCRSTWRRRCRPSIWRRPMGLKFPSRNETRGRSRTSAPCA